MKFWSWILLVVERAISSSVEEKERQPLCVPVTW